MKSLAVLTLFASAAFAQVPGIKAVYILPMTGGLDQYLAQHLTQTHALQVVADPKSADAVLTDRLGQPFEDAMARLHPRSDDEKASDHPAFRSSVSRGTIFLVDAKSRQVLWSDYQSPPHSASPSVLNRWASRIVSRLQGKPEN
jgi:hypothetical protein